MHCSAPSLAMRKRPSFDLIIYQRETNQGGLRKIG
jgi:hypothetical protein